MSDDRHFDLNAAITAAQSEDDVDPWVTFDLGRNYLAPPDSDDDHRSEDERRVPWRMNVRDLPGWLVMDFLTTTGIATMRVSQQLIQMAIDPDQWDQFHALLTDRNNPMPMVVIDQLMTRVVRSQLGIPLDR